MMFSAWEACVSGVSSRVAILIASRTSGGRLVEVCVINSTRLAARNCIGNYYFIWTLAEQGVPIVTDPK